MGVLNVNHPSARKAFSTLLSRATPQRNWFVDHALMKPGAEKEDGNSIIVTMDQLQSTEKGGTKSGYEIRYDLDGNLNGFPTAGDNPNRGAEVTMSLYSDVIQINQDRFSVIDQGKFKEGNVPYEFRERAKNRLANYWARYFDERCVAKLSGSLGDGTYTTIDTTTATSSARDVDGSVASDGNDLRAPSTGRIIYGNSRANQAAMTAGDSLTLEIVDQALLNGFGASQNAAWQSRLMTPIKDGGNDVAVLLVDYVTALQMSQDTSGRYFTVQKAMTQGGMKDTQLLKGALGVYRSPVGIDVILHSHPRLVRFSATTTGSVKVIRNLLLAQSALRVAYGRNSKDLPMFDWHEETDDHGNQLVITTGITTGIQKCAFNTTETGTTREDWGVIAIDTYANY